MITKQQQYNDLIYAVLNLKYKGFGLPKVDPLIDFLLENGIKIFDNDDSFAYGDEIVVIFSCLYGQTSDFYRGAYRNHYRLQPLKFFTHSSIQDDISGRIFNYDATRKCQVASVVNINKASIVIAFAYNDFEKERWKTECNHGEYLDCTPPLET